MWAWRSHCHRAAPEFLWRDSVLNEADLPYSPDKASCAFLSDSRRRRRRF